MGFAPQLIAPFQTGLDNDISDFLLPSDAHVEFDNVHIKHGYIEKRQGFQTLGFMVYDYGTNLDITGISLADPGVVTVTDTTNISDGQIVSLQNISGTVELNNFYYIVANKDATSFELQDLSSTNFDTSAYTAYSSGGDVFPHPSNRIMGIYQYYKTDGSTEVLVFDDKRVCKYDASNNVFNPLDRAAKKYADIFTSGDSDYVWTANWQSNTASSSQGNNLYFTNGKNKISGATPTDGVWSYNGTNITPLTLYAGPSSTRQITTVKLIFVMKDRLLFLNTVEGGNSYPQRVRWSQAQDPTIFDDVTPGKGGYVDAPTGEQIVSARSIQNAIIVYFTNSIWLLSYRSDPALPFTWTKINDFRACDSKMATAGFDRYVVSAGKRGVCASDGTDSKRIDERVERFINDNVSQDEIDKMFMQRSYLNERTWLLYPDASSSSTENDKALVFDEESKSFSTYSIAMNCLGPGVVGFNYGLEDFTVQNRFYETGDMTIETAGDETLQDFFQQDSELLFGGDITGEIFLMETDADDDGSDITSTFTTASWAPFKEEGIESQFGYIDLYVDTDINTTFSVDIYKDTNADSYLTQTMDCLPDLGYIADVSNITNANPVSFNVGSHGLSTGDVVYIYNSKGMEQANSVAFTVTVVDDDNFTGADSEGTDYNSTSWGTYETGAKVFNREFYKTKIWKRVYAGGIGNQHRVRFTSTGSNRSFRIHAYKPYFKPRGKRTI